MASHITILGYPPVNGYEMSVDTKMITAFPLQEEITIGEIEMKSMIVLTPFGLNQKSGIFYSTYTPEEINILCNGGEITTSSYRILIQGQSNAIGGGQRSLLAASPLNEDPYNYTAAQSRVYIWNPVVGAYQQLIAGTNNLAAGDQNVVGFLPGTGTPYPYPCFGIELGIAQRWMEETASGNLYLEKNTGDGQPLSTFIKGAYCYTALQALRVNSNAWLATNNITPIELATVWIQGEGNMANTQNQYQVPFTQLWVDMIVDGLITNETLIVVAQINIESANYGAGVAAAKVAFVEGNSNGRLITYINNMYPDDIHLQAGGQLQLGFDAYEKAFNTTHKSIPVGSSLIVLDNFVGVNGTHLESHTVSPTNTVSFAWTKVAGDMQIQSNRLAPISGENLYFGDTGVADALISVNLSRAGECNFAIAFRYLNSTNFWLALVENAAGTTTFYIFENLAGNYDLKDSAVVTMNMTTEYPLTVTFDGDDIESTFAGATLNATSSSGNTRTKHGIRSGLATAGNYSDAFSITQIV